MVGLLSGDSGSLECFHALKKGSAYCIHGAITDPEVAARLTKLNTDHEIYMTAHLLRDGVTRNPTDEDIAEGRALFIDSDGEPKPKSWHIPPDFMLEREDDPQHSWWAYWVASAPEPFPADAIKQYQRRIAAQYKTDDSVIDPRRIVRLPGYIRHKANETPSKTKKNRAAGDTQYRLVAGGGTMTSTLRQHDVLLPAVLPQRTVKSKTKSSGNIPDLCSEKWMDDALRCISPDLKRSDGWLNTLAELAFAVVVEGRHVGFAEEATDAEFDSIGRHRGVGYQPGTEQCGAAQQRCSRHLSLHPELSRPDYRTMRYITDICIDLSQSQPTIIVPLCLLATWSVATHETSLRLRLLCPRRHYDQRPGRAAGATRRRVHVHDAK
jgi:hypothetical protein